MDSHRQYSDQSREIDFVSSPQLREVQIFRMGNEHQLREVIVAASAAAVDDGKNWILRDGWRRQLEPGVAASGSLQRSCLIAAGQPAKRDLAAKKSCSTSIPLLAAQFRY